jgi:hypothetical protein
MFNNIDSDLNAKYKITYELLTHGSMDHSVWWFEGMEAVDHTEYSLAAGSC